MNFNGTIIITDPCYIIKDYGFVHPEPSDFNLPSSIINKPYAEYSSDDELRYKKACDEYYEMKGKHDDWKKCGCGSNMGALGLTNYICESTIYGDWSCKTLKTDEPPIELIDKLDVYSREYDDGERINAEIGELEALGNFCADSGMVAVFLLDEVLKYNPGFLEWMESHPWCVTKIDNFNGNVHYYIDDNNNAHICGEGNVNFITIQF